MKNLKKGIAILLATASVVSASTVVPLSVGAVSATAVSTEDTTSVIQQGKCGKNVNYKLTGNGILTISGTGNMYDYDNEEIIVPWVNSYVSNVVIGNGVTRIGNNAFDSKNTIVDVTIGTSVKSIGSNAFSGTSIHQLSLPKSVESIEVEAFKNCKGLEEVTLNEGLKAIDNFAFYNCSELKSVTIPSTVRSIGESAFYNCSSLETVDVLSKNVILGNYVFDNTKWYNTQPYGLVYTGTVLYDYKGNAYYENQTIEIKNGTTAIAPNVFKNFNGIKKINIPNSVNFIGSTAFAGCTSLQLTKLPSGLKYIGESAFSNCKNITVTSIPGKVTTIKESAFRNCSKISTINLPVSVKSIGSRVFLGCSNLKKVYIKNTVKEIGMDALGNCKNLKDVYFTGTRLQWNSLYKNAGYKLNATIHCSKTSIKLSGKTVNLYVKGSKKNVTVYDGKGKTTYKVYNTGIAKITSDGKVVGVKKGVTYVEVKNNGVTAKFKVVVQNPKLNKTSLSLKKGKSYTLKITGKVGKATFKSSNTTVATVSKKGNVKAKSKGKTVVTVKSNGITLKCNVTVK